MHIKNTLEINWKIKVLANFSTILIVCWPSLPKLLMTKKLRASDRITDFSMLWKLCLIGASYPQLI